MSIIPITSQAHFKSILDGSTYVVVDFYADWCGPCKAIAPIYSHLATAESKPGRMTFVKVDVDSQQSISRQYGVTAMPTFLIFKNSSVINTLRGADPNALRSAVLSASADAAKSPAKSSVSFQSKGHVLGGEGTPSKVQRGSIGEQARDFGSRLTRGGFMAALIQFFTLYFVTLFSLDPKAAAENSAVSQGSAARKNR